MSYRLALYDVRGKQQFIYGTNKIKEIVGASYVIRDIFKDYLQPAAQKYAKEDGIKDGIYIPKEGEKFSTGNFENRIKNDEYIGEVIYDGGGNFYTLFRDETTFIEVTKQFTTDVLKEIGTLKIQGWSVDTDLKNYRNDQRKLMNEYKEYGGHETLSYPINTLPIVQVDPLSSRPLTNLSYYVYGNKKDGKNPPEKVSKDRYRKLEKYRKDNSPKEQGKFLDDLVKEKGQDSLLAIIYIDGNGMGAKVQNALNDVSPNYEQSINKLREFSYHLDQEYVRGPMRNIDKCLKQLSGTKDDDVVEKRVVVEAGDEMTIICQASYAMEVVKTYFDYQNHLNEKDNGNRSSCAGIAIFHSHAPFADAYRIAEACCESGKKLMKDQKVEKAQLIDFHYCQTGIDISLDKIREEEKSGKSLPWYYGKEKNSQNVGFTYKKKYEGIQDTVVNNVLSYLQTMKHSNVKILLRAAMSGIGELEMELARIDAHKKDTNKGEIDSFDKLKKYCKGISDETLRNVISDVVMVYDRWFLIEDQGE